MVKVAIVGGRLQGIEAVYLAKKAGFYSILIDKEENPPAKGLCDEFFQLDVRAIDKPLLDILTGCDFVLPTTESLSALNALRVLKQNYSLNIAFDFDAYEISSSKLRSDSLFHENGIPAPLYYPDGTAPYVAKPSEASGSKGVRIFEDRQSVADFYKSNPKDWIVQEYLEGRAYSIEVIGTPGRYKTYQMTEIHVDDKYDCCLVTSPCLEAPQEKLSQIAIRIAGLLKLNGIMDVEAIFHNGVMKVLEIDARLPSQTPAAVLHSTGINLIAELYNLFCGNWEVDISCEAVFQQENAAAYELIEVSNSGVRLCGEGIMSDSAPLEYSRGLLGTRDALIDYNKDNHRLRAILMYSEETPDALSLKRQRAKDLAIENFRQRSSSHDQ